MEAAWGPEVGGSPPRRARDPQPGISLLAFAKETDWESEDIHKQTLEQHQAQLRKAQHACFDQLQEVWQERKKLGLERDGWPQWLELGTELEKWLLDSLPPRTALLTMLSNEQDHPIQGHKIQDPATARSECNAPSGTPRRQPGA